MVTEDPRPDDDPDDDRRRQPAEPNTEQFPAYPGGDFEDEIVAFDDHEFAAIGANQAGVGFDRVDLIATREPSDLVRRYLFPTEKFRGEWRRHWIHLVKRLSLGVLATFVLGYLAGYFAKQGIQSGLTILVLVWLAVIGWVLWDVAEWYYDRFILTNKRVMVIDGIVSPPVA